MSDPNVYQGSGKGGTQITWVNMASAFAVDMTGGTDCGPAITAGLTLLGRSGQGAFFPAGTLDVATAVTNASKVPILIGEGCTVGGAHGPSLTTPAAGAVVYASAPGTLPIIAYAQVAHETDQLWTCQPGDGGTVFSQQVDSTLANGTYDNVGRIGWNINDAVTGKMRSYISWESSYIPSPGGNVQAETHLEYVGTWGNYRPWSSSCVQLTGQSVLLLQFADGTDSSAGGIYIFEEKSGAEQWRWTTGELSIYPSDYIFTPALGLIVSSPPPTSDVAPHDFVFTVQPPPTSSVAHVVGANFVVNLPAPNSGTVFSQFSVREVGGATIVNIGIDQFTRTNVLSPTNPLLLASAASYTEVQAAGGAVYLDSTGGTIFRISGAEYAEINATIFKCASALGGYNTQPFAWAGEASPNTVALGVGGTTVLSAAQSLLPFFLLTTGTLTSNVILDFSTNAGNGVAGEFTIDLSGVGSLGAFTLGFKNVGTTVTISASQLTALRATGKTGIKVATYGAAGIAIV